MLLVNDDVSSRVADMAQRIGNWLISLDMVPWRAGRGVDAGHSGTLQGQWQWIDRRRAAFRTVLGGGPLWQLVRSTTYCVFWRQMDNQRMAVTPMRAAGVHHECVFVAQLATCIG